MDQFWILIRTTPKPPGDINNSNSLQIRRPNDSQFEFYIIEVATSRGAPSKTLLYESKDFMVGF